MLLRRTFLQAYLLKKILQKKFTCFLLVFMNLFICSECVGQVLPIPNPIDSIYPVSCIPILDSSCFISVATLGITNFSFGSIYNPTAAETHRHHDYSCCKTTSLTAGNTYTFSVTTCYSQGEYIKVWIDYNSNGEFSDGGEEVFSGFANHTLTGSITIPTTVTFNRKLRLRIVSSIKADSLNYCLAYCGESEDYAILVPNDQVLKPVAYFTITEGTKACYKKIASANTSTNAITYRWDLGDGIGILESKNITYRYNIPGTYTITLSACNNYGCDTARKTITLDSYVAPIPAVCPLNIRTGGGRYLSNFRFDNLLYNQDMEEAYNNFTCKHIHVNAASTYKITAQAASNANLQVWIDFNNDGIFTYEETLNKQLGPANIPIYALIDPAAVQNKPLRMRVITNHFGWLYNACTENNGQPLEYVEVDDYTVFVHEPLTVTADFEVLKTNTCTDLYVAFKNHSSNAANYLWDFGDGTTSQNVEPTHAYASPGVYTVKLKAYNPGNVDSITRTNYITVLQALPIPVITPSGKTLTTNSVADGYQWYSNSVEIPGATTSSYTPVNLAQYSIVIKNTNGCKTSSALFEYGPINVKFNLINLHPTVCGINKYLLDNYTTNATNFTILWGDGSSSDSKLGEVPPNHDYKIGIYTVSLIGCNVYNQCDTLTKPNMIAVYDTLSIPVISMSRVGNEYEFHATSKDTGIVYDWLVKGNNGYTGLIAGSVIKPSEDGLYSVRTRKYNCVSSSSAELLYFPLRVKFPAYNVGICGDTSYSISFTNESTNAVNYLWDFGDASTSTDKEPHHTFRPGIYTVSLKACSDTICDTFIQPNCIRLVDTPFVPKITVPDRDVYFCSGFGITQTIGTPYHPDYSYKWYRNYTLVDTATHSTYEAKEKTSTLMHVVVTNELGCVATASPLNLVEDITCVWPGDANRDEQVTNLDLLPIGLYYSSTGTSRTTSSNVYTAFSSDDWALQTMTGNMKHVDCNGDGIIDSNDTMAVHLNFNAPRVYPPIRENKPKKAGIPTLTLQTSKSIYKPGEWVEAELIVGDLDVPVNGLYGIAFNIDYDKLLVEQGTVSITYSPSWFALPGEDALTFSKTDDLNGTAYGAEVGITHVNKSGYGKIAHLRFKIKSETSEVKKLELAVTSYAVDSAAERVDFFIPPFSLQVNPVITSVNESGNDNNIRVYPNPFVNNTVVSYTLTKKSDVAIELYNIRGQRLEMLENTVQPAGTYYLDFKAKEKGYQESIYLIKFLINKKTTMKRMVKLQ